MSALVDDPEARLEYLLDRGVLVERSDGTIATGDAFQADLEVYEDSYLDASDEKFAETVASLFDLSVEEADERVEATGMTRREVATFLALRSHLDDPGRSRDELALMASMVAEVGPASPVPEWLIELTDETYEAHLDEHGHVAVLVFQRNCGPCDDLKEDLPALVDEAPDAVSFAGVDGDEVPSFRRAFDVTVAPTTLLFDSGDLSERIEGRRPVDVLLQAFEDVYGSDGAD